MKRRREKLKRLILYKYGSIKAFADEVGLSRIAVYDALSGDHSMRDDTIRKYCEYLKIPTEEIGEIFFT